MKIKKLIFVLLITGSVYSALIVPPFIIPNNGETVTTLNVDKIRGCKAFPINFGWNKVIVHVYSTSPSTVE